MNEGGETIRVNFSRPVPLFPLDAPALLPHQVLPLHIFEPRYRQMISDALDASGLIAMAVFRGNRWKQEYHGRPPLRSAVCLGRISQHEKLEDGRYNILLQGVCRASIRQELAPVDGRLYREALLAPVESSDAPEGREASELRSWLGVEFRGGPLSRLRIAGSVSEIIDRGDVPTPAIMELVSYAVLAEPELRYRLLAEGDPEVRATLIRCELEHLSDLIRRAGSQHAEAWPKGLSWN